MSGKLKLYSTTPGNNTSAPPDGWPEGMAPSAVNNAARQMMAQMAEWYRDAEWVDYGDTIVGAAGQVYTISGDVTARYTVGRAIRQNSSDASRGIVTASSYSAPNTSVTVNGYVPSAAPTAVELGIGDKAISRLSAGSSSVDFAAFSGSIRETVTGTLVGTWLSTGLDLPEGVSFGSNIVAGADLSKHIALWGSTFGLNINTSQINIVAPVGCTIAHKINAVDVLAVTGSGATLTGIPVNTAQGADIASAATVNLDTATGNVVNITGSVTITAFTLSNGRSRVVRFTGAPQITAGASLVVLPGNTSVVAQAGDMATIEAIGGVKYVRLFRAGAAEFKAATGSIVAADTTIALPAGTYSRVRVAVKNLKASTDYAFAARLNGSSATVYDYATFVSTAGGGSASEGDTNANAHVLSRYNGGSLVDDSVTTTNPLSGDIIVTNPESTDHINIKNTVEYRGAGASQSVVLGTGRYKAAGPVTSISLHLRTTFAPPGINTTGVTPTAGSYELWLTP